MVNFWGAFETSTSFWLVVVRTNTTFRLEAKLNLQGIEGSRQEVCYEREGALVVFIEAMAAGEVATVVVA